MNSQKKINMSINIRNYFPAHPYHIVGTSPWPIAVSFGLLWFMGNTALTMHGYINNKLIMFVSLGVVVYAMALWFRDITIEGTLLGEHTTAVVKGLTIGFILFVVSEALVFVGVFWAYLHSAMSPTVELGGVWPPVGIDAILPTALPLLNTILLLSSGACLKCIKFELFKPSIQLQSPLSNLPFNKPRVSSLKRIGPHNIDILSILIGSLLGDGTLERDGNGTRIGLYQEKSHGEYLLFVHKILFELGYCKPELPKIQTRKGLEGKLRYVMRFRSYTFSSFNWIHDSFYPKVRKVVPKDINLEIYLTPLALAIWIMDDGCLLKNRGISFSTNSFTLDENKYLGEILKKKYDLNYSIVKTGAINQYNIYIVKESSIRLGRIVKKHMAPSMYYKLPSECFK